MAEGSTLGAEAKNTERKIEQASNDGLGTKEARTSDGPIIAGKPLYPTGITLYLVMIALMLSMFLVSHTSTLGSCLSPHAALGCS